MQSRFRQILRVPEQISYNMGTRQGLLAYISGKALVPML